MKDSDSPLGVFSQLAKLPTFLKLFWEVFRNPKTSRWMKLSVVAAIAYIFSPLDILPDPFTGIGYVDDLIFSLLVLERFILTAPGEVLVESAENVGIDPEELAEDIEDAILATSAAFATLWRLIESSRDNLISRFSKKFESITGETVEGAGEVPPVDGAGQKKDTETPSPAESGSE